MPIHLDFETRSRANLARTGMFRYFEDISTEILCMAFAFDDGESIYLWSPRGEDIPGYSPEAMHELVGRIRQGDELHGWNVAFERQAWESRMWKYGFRMPRPEQWRCTQARAAALALPLRLELCSVALGSPVPKNMEGNRLMRQMSRPRKPTKKDPREWIDDEESHRRLQAYCQQDVRAERWISKQLRDLSPSELEAWQLDQVINRRGVQVDVELCSKASTVHVVQQQWLDSEVRRITGFDEKGKTGARSAKAVAAQRKWAAARGVDLPDLKAETVREELERDDQVRAGEDSEGAPLPNEVRELLEVRQRGSLSSLSKFGRFLEMTCDDGRFRGAYQYYGARTGRWAGRGVQVQNLKRGSADEQEETIETLMLGGVSLMRRLFDSPLDRLSKAVRGALIAPPGKILVAGDFASVEARGVFWLAGQEDALEAYRAGADLYCEMAADIFREPASSIRAGYERHDDRATFRRFVGKQTVLGCGYGMGPEKFIGTCKNFGIQVGMDLAQRAIAVYRDRFFLVRKCWREMGQAALRAVGKPGCEVRGPRTRWKVIGRFLHGKLPSGRLLSFYRPRLREHTVRHKGREWLATSVEYQGLRMNRWGWVRTYGGDLVESVVQGFSRDLLLAAMVRAENNGWPICLHSHDEIVAEVEEGGRSHDVKAFEILMAHPPKWAEGLPIAVEGWAGRRYRKA